MKQKATIEQLGVTYLQIKIFLRRRRKRPFPPCFCVGQEIRREKPTQEQVRIVS